MPPPNKCLAESPSIQARAFSWDRAVAAPGGIVGLWSAGFIANRCELIALLGGSAHGSDLELATAVYSRRGREVSQLIHGPFSWIVWDGNRQHLIAFRDRLGIHEIFYQQEQDTVLLAGKIECVFEVSRSRTTPNPAAVHAQIHGQAPAPGKTFYEGIRAVAPGCVLTIMRDRIESEAYWRPELRPLLKLPDDEAYGKAFRDLLLLIVAEYTQEDEVGVTLSGGLDSTTVAAAIRESSPKTRVTAFSWTAPELPEADESEAIAAVCLKLGCRAVSIAADRHWPLSSEPGIEPEVATPLFNYYSEAWNETFRAARQRGVRVLFSGLSGDHLFGDTVFSYPDLLLTGRWWRLVAELLEHRRHSERSLAQIVRRFVLSPIADAYLPTRERNELKPVAWLGPRLRHESIEGPSISRRLLPGRRGRLKLLRDPWIGTVASHTTRHAARHGIDYRHPLLDHRLFEFAASLPSTQTFSDGRQKVILRNAMRGRLPVAVLDRRDRTYPIAIAHRGLREREQAKVWALMTDMRAAQMGFVDERRLRAAYTDYLAGGDEGALFWHTITLEAWLRRYFP